MIHFLGKPKTKIMPTDRVAETFLVFPFEEVLNRNFYVVDLAQIYVMS